MNTTIRRSLIPGVSLVALLVFQIVLLPSHALAGPFTNPPDVCDPDIEDCGTNNPNNPTTVTPSIDSFLADPTSIISGTISKLSWSTSYTQSCTSPDFSTGNAVSSTGTNVTPTTGTTRSTKTYNLTCTSSTGNATSTSTSVEVIPAKGCYDNADGVIPIAGTIYDSINGWSYTSPGGNPCGGSGSSCPFQCSGYNPTVHVTAYTPKCCHGSGELVFGNGNVTTGIRCIDTPPNLADLTASAVTPTSVPQGTATLFHSTITNIGTAVPMHGFMTKFQQASDASGTGATNISPEYTYTSDLAANLTTNGTFDATTTITFPTTGDTYVRACADSSTDSTRSNTIPELREDNNCSPWTKVTVTGDAAPTVTFAATPTIIVTGGSSMLTWSSTNATSCTSADFTTNNATSNSTGVSVSPTATKTYKITCTGSGGSTSASATITVNQPLAASCSVSPTTAGVNTNVTWSATVSGGSGLYTYSWGGTDFATTTGGASFSKSYSTAGAKSATLSVSDGSTTKAVKCSNTVTVTNNAADLTVTDFAPLAVIAGKSSTFTGTIYNAGNGDSGTFSSTAYVCLSTDTACMNSLAKAPGNFWDKIIAYLRPKAEAAASADGITLTGSSIAGKSSGTQTGTKTMATVGTYKVRFCADLPANKVSESNENNNCGDWQVLAVCPSDNTVSADGKSCVAPPGGTDTITCSPATSNPTSLPATVNFTTTYTGSAPTTYTWDDGQGGDYGHASTASRTFTAGTPNGTYNINVTAPGKTVSTCAVTIGGGTCTPTISNLKADPARVPNPGATTISWTVTGKTACVLSSPGHPNLHTTPAASSCSTSTDDHYDVTGITNQTTYTLTCGSVHDDVTVNMIPKIIEF